MADFTQQDMQDMLKEMENEQTKGKFVSQYWGPDSNKEGTFPIRIISPAKAFGEKVFYFKRKVHWVNKRPYLCLNQTLKDKNGDVHEACECPICKKVKQLYNIAGDDRTKDEWKIASSISAKDRYVSRVIVRGKTNEKGEDAEAIPEFWEFGKTIYEVLFNFVKNPDEFGNFLSLKDGSDFNIVKTGKGRDVKYTGSYLSRKPTPIFSDIEKLTITKNAIEKMGYNQLVEFSSEEDMISALNEVLNGPKEDETPKVQAGEKIKSEVAKAVSANINDTAGSGDDELDAILNAI